MTMKVLLMISLIGVISLNYGEGAKRINVQKRMTDGMLHFKSQTNRRSIEDNHPDIKDILKLQNGEALKEVSSIITTKGTTKIKLKETYKGIPVVGEGVVVEKTKDGKVTGEISGQLIEHVKDDVGSVQPKLTAQEAFEAALKARKLRNDEVKFDVNDAKLEIYVEEEHDDSVKGKLAYILSFFVDSPKVPSQPFFVIDANTGKILDTWEGLQNGVLLEKRDNTFIEEHGIGGSEKIGAHTFGIDYDKLNVSKKGDMCFLENENVRVIDANNTDPVIGGDTYSYACGSCNSDYANGAHSPTNDAFFFSTATFKMYKEWFDIVPIPPKLPVYVHANKNYVNAYWNSYQKITVFGDGDSGHYPLVSLGIVAHEISHGFTHYNSGLIYSRQSGGMNEAFSDIASEALEFYLHNKSDFMIGKGVFKNRNRPMRYLDDPEKGGSIGHFSDYSDYLDVHRTSGIFNKAFSILAKKSTWDEKKAFHAFVIANKIYWRENSTFQDGASGVKKAANDLGYDENDVVDAFCQVGIEI